MTTNEFRRATVIELYAAHVVLARGDDETIFTSGYMPGTVVDGDEIDTLMRAFGIESATIERHRDKAGKLFERGIDSEEIHLFQDRETVKCREIKARVLGADLIEIVYTSDANPTWVERLTYSGPFTVAWAPEEGGQ